MKYILDTHAFIYAIEKDEENNVNNLSKTADEIIHNRENELFMSYASLYEMAVKYNKGNLVFDDPFNQVIVDERRFLGIRLLDITIDHIKMLSTLIKVPGHKDPFDRMIIAQSLSTGIPIISKDGDFKSYPVNIVW